MIIAEETLKKIRESADIVKIISDYVKLEKKGGNFVGLCPFHPDTNPSMTVSPAKQIYKCFSCGASGNVFTFVQDYEHVSFVNAVKIIGDKTGNAVDIEVNEGYQNLDKYYDILTKAASFYEFYLKNTAEGKTAIEYLNHRQLDDDIIKRFKIGLSPKEPDLLYKTLTKDKHQPLDMIEAGVIRSGNSYYDVFRNRIMFPIEDLNGKVVGFSGRIYENKKADEAKYMNSSENIVFKKGNILYNYRQAINEIKMKDKAFLFEGFMDVIAAYRADVYNAIASMGTALTKEHIKAISKATTNIVICFDGDYAGIEATKKAIHLFNEAKFNVKAVLMPDELDPDEYINQFGKEKLNDYLNNHAISGLDYLYEIEKRSLILADISSIEKFKNAIFRYMNYYKSNVLNEKYLQKLSSDLNISIESLKSDFLKIPFEIKPEVYTPPVEDAVLDFPEMVKSKKAKPRKEKFIKSERAIIKIIYTTKDKKTALEFQNQLDLNYVDKSNRTLLISLFDYFTKHDEFDDLVFRKTLNPTQIQLLENILSNANFDFIEIKDDLVYNVVNYENVKEMEAIAQEVETNNAISEEKVIHFSTLKRKSVKFKN